MQASEPKEMVKLDYEWLKENFEVMMTRAMNDPTEANVANFAYTQRLLLDMSSRFQSRMTDFMMGEEELDESIRRPNSAFALNEFKSEVNQRVANTITQISDDSLGVWFFYSSTCQYCFKMIPVIKRFQQNYGVKVLAVSLDGGIIPGMEDMEIVFDNNQEVARKFNVTMTPTTMLVMKDNTTELVAAGMRSLPELEKRYIRAARIKGLIDNETYQRTKSVYEKNIYSNENGVLMISKNKLEEDPRFLSEALRSRLSDVTAYGTQLLPPSSEE
jgi:conjugal transfer pilus assembly protein TraF